MKLFSFESNFYFLKLYLSRNIFQKLKIFLSRLYLKLFLLSCISKFELSLKKNFFFATRIV